MYDPTRPKALFLGSIGVLIETSDLQREAFNAAFREAGLEWHWDQAAYRRMLEAPGGEARIAAHAAERGETVDAAALHAAKVRYFAAAVESGHLPPRPGVAELIAAAKGAGVRVGLVTSTGPETVELILKGLAPALTREDFAFIGNREMVAASKPAPDIYEAALKALQLGADNAVAVEDTPESAAAAIAAGIATYGFPGRAAEGREFPGARAVLSRLDAVRLLGLDPAATAPPVMMR